MKIYSIEKFVLCFMFYESDSWVYVYTNDDVYFIIIIDDYTWKNLKTKKKEWGNTVVFIKLISFMKFYSPSDI